MSPNELNPIEILEKLDAFYNNAWDKLIIYTTIFLTLIGIVLPIIIQWWQSRNLKIREEALKSEIDDLFERKTKELEEKIIGIIDEKFKTESDKINSKVNKIKSSLLGTQFHLQANISENYKEIMESLVRAAEYYMIAEDLVNLRAVLEMINSNIPFITKQDISELVIDDINLETLIENLDKMNNNDALIHLIKEMKKLVAKIPEKSNQ